MAGSTSETPVLDLLASMTADSLEASSLDTETLALVRIAALAAVDAPTVSYLLNLGAASEIGIDAEQVHGVLAAIAPIVGTARIASATGKIVDALEVAIEIAELEERSKRRRRALGQPPLSGEAAARSRAPNNPRAKGHDMLWFILGAIIWIAIAFWPARVAARKGHSFFLFFVFSLMFFPLALLVAYMVDDRRVVTGQRGVTAWRARPAEQPDASVRPRLGLNRSDQLNADGVQGPLTRVTCSPTGHSLTRVPRPSTCSVTRTVASSRSIARTTLALT